MSESNPDYYAIERALIDVLARASAALSQQLSPSTPPASAPPGQRGSAMTESPELTALVDAVEGLLDRACWYPASHVCTPEMLVDSFAVSQLQAAYNAYVETYASAPSDGEGASA